MALTVGTIYTLKNRKTGRGLNVYASDLSSTSNVVQWSYDPYDRDQQWKLLQDGGSYFLGTIHNTGYVLDAYMPTTTGANADVWPKTSADRSAQALSLISQGGDYYKIKLNAYGTYLTAIGNENGTQTGFGSTSSGNVYWTTNSTSETQQWELIEKGREYTYPTTSLHDLSAGKVYQITNLTTGRNLNLYGADVSQSSNVIQWTADANDSDQNWTLVHGSGGYNYLEFTKNPNYVLDAYLPKISGANADVWLKGDEKAQQLIIRRISSGKYTISLRNFPNLYLTAVGYANGTKGGYNPDSQGNIYWAEHTGNSNQHWNFTENTKSVDYPTTSNHDLTAGKVYQISSNASGRNVNLYGGDVSKDSNVVQWAADTGDTDQNWTLVRSSGSYNYLEFTKNPSFVLDAYMPKPAGANADVWEKGDESAQQLIIRKVSAGKYTISLKQFPNLFLTAYGDKNGSKTGYGAVDGNIGWADYKANPNQFWNFKENALSTGTTLPGTHNPPTAGTYNIIGTYGYLNVTGGIDMNGTNVLTYAKDGTIDQVFKLEIVSAATARLRAQCSSDGGNRVLDAYRPSGEVQSGTKAQIWDANDDASQLLNIHPVGNGKYIIALAGNKLALTATGESKGAIFSKYTANDTTQHWTFSSVSTWTGEGTSGSTENAGGPTSMAGVQWIPSPHFFKGRNGEKPLAWAFHITTNTAQSAINTFTHPTSEVSANFIIRKDGGIVQLVDIANGAWCNGTSLSPDSKTYYGKSDIALVCDMKTNANFYTISIEFENYNPADGNITEAQISAAARLIPYVNKEYDLNIPYDRGHYFGHCEITPQGGKSCPGEKFPYDAIMARLQESSGENSGGSTPPKPTDPIDPVKWSYFFRDDDKKYFKGYRHYYKDSSGKIDHKGIDVITPYDPADGKPRSPLVSIYSVCAGVVTRTSLKNANASMGNYVVIKADKPVKCTVGSTAGNPIYGDHVLTLRYLHMDSLPNVSEGDHVTANTLLGYVGNTGAGSGANDGSNIAHLHFDANNIGTWDGTQIGTANTVDPAELFAGIVTFQFGEC